MKNKILLISLVLGIVVSVFCLVVILPQNFNMTLNFAGYNTKDVTTFYEGLNWNNNRIRVVKTVTKKDNKNALVILEKNNGLWKVYSESSVETGGILNVFVIGTDLNTRHYDNESKTINDIEMHMFYYGENAVKLIDLNDEDFKGNMSASICQDNNKYYIHETLYNNQDEGAKVIPSIIEVLKEKGFIE